MDEAKVRQIAKEEIRDTNDGCLMMAVLSAAIIFASYNSKVRDDEIRDTMKTMNWKINQLEKSNADNACHD